MSKASKGKRPRISYDKAKFAGRSILKYLLTLIVGLFVGPYFVRILPGPKVIATIQPMSGNTAGSTGCLYYLITIRTQEEPIEYIYLKAQFPDTINNYKVGLPPEYQMPDGRRVAAQLGELGKDPNGNCAVVQGSNDTGDVQASAAANMLSLHASKLPPKTTIMGMVATTEGKSIISPKTGSVYREGQYEYLKLGYTVRRKLPVSNRGVIPAAAANH